MRPRTSPSLPPWQVYFHDFAVPKSVLDLVHLGEAIDTSSPNDSSPSFSTADSRVLIFVDHPAPSRRELGDATRYFVQVYDTDGNPVSVEYEGDSVTEAVQAFRSAAGLASRAHTPKRNDRRSGELYATFLTVPGARDLRPIVGLGRSFRAAKVTASRALRQSGVEGTVFLKSGTGETLSTYDGRRWRDLYDAEFLRRRHGIVA